MSKRIVMKFGGSSVGSANAIRLAASLARATYDEGNEVVMVVSAMRGVTDILINGAKRAATGDESAVKEAKELLWEKHLSAAEELLPEKSRSVLGYIEAELSHFGHLVSATSVLGEITTRAMDFISSLGERFSAQLVSAYLNTTYGPSEAIIANDIIVTDNNFGNANPLLDLTGERARARILPLLEAGTMPVVTGFMGATEDGIVTTLGRGGSDYTAAILGHALDADEIWIWSDVDGVLTADPRVVPDAHPIAKLSYQEAAELAYFGAKVLHPKTVRPAVKKEIPIRMLNTFNPAYPGTWITKTSNGTSVKAVTCIPKVAEVSLSGSGCSVKAVTSIPKVAEVTVSGRGMLGVPGVAARLFGAVAQLGTSVLMISQASSEQSICFVVREKESKAVVDALEKEFERELYHGDIERIWNKTDSVIIAVVGAGMRGQYGIAGKLFTALGMHKINVLSIAQGSSEYNISIVVDQADAKQAVQVIHDVFQLGKAV